MKKVNFFIVGAPKAGTTALYTYLNDHPDIFLPSHKEPHYFSEDYPNLGGRINTIQAYEKLYATNEKCAAGDASVCYLASDHAAQRIHKYNPNAKIIVMLRQPVDLFLSEHSQLIYSFYEDEENPFRAWQLQAARKQGESLPKSCREPELLQYKKTCLLGKNLARYIEQFGQNSVLPLFFDDFIKSPLKTYQTALAFIEIDYDGRQDFPVVNEAKQHQGSRKWLTRLLISPPGILGKWHAKLRAHIATTDSKAIKAIELTARKLALRSSVKKTSIKLPPDQYEAILAELTDDICLLEGLTNRDLTHWKSTREV